MSFSISSSKLTGNPGATGWAQVHDFAPEDEIKHKERGHLFAVVATRRQKEGVESVVAGRELLTRLHEEYFGNLNASAFNALRDACEKVIKEFKQSWGDVQVSAVAVLGNVVYTACGGGAQVSIFRDGMLAKVLLSKKAGAVSASGYPKDDDILILGTNSFFNIFADGTLRAALEGKEIASAVESLAPTIHSEAGRGDLGAVFLKFEEGVPIKGEDRQVKKVTRKTPSFVSKYFSIFKSTKDNLRSHLAKLPERKIYVKEGVDELKATQNRRVAVSIGATLLLLLVVSIGFGIKQKRDKDERLQYEDRLLSARHQLDEAISLYSLDAKRARELFVESKGTVDQLKTEGVSDPQLDEVELKLKDNQGKILGEFNLEAELFVDLSLVSEGFNGDDLTFSEEQIYVLDRQRERIIKTIVDTKGSEVVAGPDKVNDPKNLAAYSDRVYIGNQDGIFEVTEDNKQVVEEGAGDNTLIHAYAANLYVLDKSTSIIWRHTAFGEGFSTGREWLVEGIGPDLSKIISWTIDGTIWLLNDTGKIFKYSSGNPQSFQISGVAPSLIRPKAIYTNEEIEFLYILEPEEERVVVLNKDGEYRAQYTSARAREAKGLAVSEKEGKIILLAGNKLYSIEIKHLD